MFRHSYSAHDRREEATRILSKYPDRIPIIVERCPRCTLPILRKRKYLCPATMTIAEFMYVLRKQVTLHASEAMFLLTDQGTMATTASVLSDIYAKHADTDKFLYLQYSSESTFGTFGAVRVGPPR